jgi:hypothetical protein
MVSIGSHRAAEKNNVSKILAGFRVFLLKEEIQKMKQTRLEKQNNDRDSDDIGVPLLLCIEGPLRRYLR